jgi:hypothetical protein
MTGDAGEQHVRTYAPNDRPPFSPEGAIVQGRRANRGMTWGMVLKGSSSVLSMMWTATTRKGFENYVYSIISSRTDSDVTIETPLCKQYQCSPILVNSCRLVLHYQPV